MEALSLKRRSSAKLQFMDGPCYARVVHDPGEGTQIEFYWTERLQESHAIDLATLVSSIHDAALVLAGSAMLGDSDRRACKGVALRLQNGLMKDLGIAP